KTAFLTQKRGLQEPKSTFFVSFHWLTLIIGSKTAILRERLPPKTALPTLRATSFTFGLWRYHGGAN
ncbi:MAG: hypothetical protein WC058_08970, partial [Phycisphaeraceae bacterium]